MDGGRDREITVSYLVHVHKELTEIFPKLRAWQRYSTSIFMTLQKWHNVKHFSAGFTENPQNHVHSKNTAEISFWVCKSVTVQNLFRADKNAPYLCSAHGFGGSLSALQKNVLHRGTFAEPERYLCTIFAMHNPGENVSLVCTPFWGFSINPAATCFASCHFCRAMKLLVQYLYHAQPC